MNITLWYTDLQVADFVHAILYGFEVVDNVPQVYDFQGYVLVVRLHQRFVHRAERPFAQHPVENHSPARLSLDIGGHDDEK